MPARKRRRWEDEEEGDEMENAMVDCDDTSDDEVAALTPGQEYVSYLSTLLFSRKVSAEQFCILMYWSAEAGMEEARKYAKAPGGKTGHYSRHCNETLQVFKQRDKLYIVEVIGKGAEGRGPIPLLTLPPHEAIDEFARRSPDYSLRVQEKSESNEFPPAYYLHPAVIEHGAGNVAPLGVFVDGVAYSNVDTVIGFWVICLTTGQRFLAAVVRKCLLFDCSCKGWCTLWQVWTWLRWSLEACQAAAFPLHRHDNTSWLASDSKRSELAGSPMAVRGCLLLLKADWSELCTSFGIPAWNDGMRPCFGCNCDLGSMHSWRGSTPSNLVWRANGLRDYWEACERCEIRVQVPQGRLQDFCNHLRYDARKAGLRGRTLRVLMPEFGLVPGDRLEPSPELGDVGALEEQTKDMVDAVFWRVSSETLARHRNPLLCEALHSSPSMCMTVDSMHALNLGVMLVYARVLVWRLIREGAWAQTPNFEEQVAISITAMAAGYKLWYARRRAAHPGENLIRVPINKKLLGDPDVGPLRTKAAATWTFMLFLLDVGEERVSLLSAELVSFLQAGRSLEAMVALFKEAPPQLSALQIQQAWDYWKGFLTKSGDVEDLLIPKCHLLFHLLERLDWFGNPRMYSNWQDESLNRILKTACQGISQKTFEFSLLLRMVDLLQQ